MRLDRLCALVERALAAPTGLTGHVEAGIRLTVQPIDRHDGTGAAGQTAQPITRTINSASFGLFHLQPTGGATPFVSAGDVVAAGQKIALIEAMKVFSPVISDGAGRIVAVLAEHGAEVENGQPLFRLE